MSVTTLESGYVGTACGYDPAFLSIPLPLPGLTAGGNLTSPPLPYRRFSVVMQRHRKLPLFAAVNISRQPSVGEHYIDDVFDFSNGRPRQHEFIAGRTLWLGVADYALHNPVTSDSKVSVFSGPVLGDGDPGYRGVALPLRYWKIVAMVRTDGKPSVTAYLLSHRALLDEFRTERTAEQPKSFGYGAYRTFQIPVRRIADLTGLDLAAYAAADPLERFQPTGLPCELVHLNQILL
jgi:endonuclease G